jgi:hypothetical protein
MRIVVVDVITEIKGTCRIHTQIIFYDSLLIDIEDIRKRTFFFFEKQLSSELKKQIWV